MNMRRSAQPLRYAASMCCFTLPENVLLGPPYCAAKLLFYRC
jgi:hypothetical protein